MTRPTASMRAIWVKVRPASFSASFGISATTWLRYLVGQPLQDVVPDGY